MSPALILVNAEQGPSEQVGQRPLVWEKASGALVYDNQLDAPEDADPTTAIGGGSIVIHK